MKTLHRFYSLLSGLAVVALACLSSQAYSAGSPVVPKAVPVDQGYEPHVTAHNSSNTVAGSAPYLQGMQKAVYLPTDANAKELVANAPAGTDSKKTTAIVDATPTGLKTAAGTWQPAGDTAGKISGVLIAEVNTA